MLSFLDKVHTQEGVGSRLYRHLILVFVKGRFRSEANHWAIEGEGSIYLEVIQVEVVTEPSD